MAPPAPRAIGQRIPTKFASGNLSTRSLSASLSPARPPLVVSASWSAAACRRPLPAEACFGSFCYSLLIAPPNDKTYAHPPFPRKTPHPPHPHLQHLPRSVSFHPRRFIPLLAGLGVYGAAAPPHALYLGVFPQARSPTGGAPLAHQGNHQRAENHPSLGPVDYLRVDPHPRLGSSLRLVSRPALAHDSFRSPRLRRLSLHLLGDEGEQLRLPHHSGRGGPESHFRRTLSPRPPSHVLRRGSHAGFHAARARLLVGAAGFSPRHPVHRPPPPPRRKNAPPRPPRLFRILPPHPLPPRSPPLVVSVSRGLPRPLASLVGARHVVPVQFRSISYVVILSEAKNLSSLFSCLYRSRACLRRQASARRFSPL